MAVIQRLVHKLRGSDESHAEPDQGAEDRIPLYHCERCKTTYITDGMEACPECSDEVESVPTEQDLGMV